MALFTFLGTGTSQGIPMIACPCEVCSSSDPKDKRLRTSAAIDIDDLSIVIDSGPDFRQQMLRDKRRHLDAILYTHGHKDHIAGLDDIRAYNYFQNEAIDLYMDKLTEDNIRMEFSYIFLAEPYPGIPRVDIHRVNAGEEFQIQNVHILPIEVMHYKLPVIGYRIGDMSYITDANAINEPSMEMLRGTKYLILNALRHEKHISHFSLEEAIKISEDLGVYQTYFTHISHQLGRYEDVSKVLPRSINLAYDGLQFEF